MAHGQWGNLGGYIYGNAVLYSPNILYPIDPIPLQITEEDDKIEEEEKVVAKEKYDTGDIKDDRRFRVNAFRFE